MSESPSRRVVTTWYGAFVVGGDAPVEPYLFPRSAAALTERRRLRRAGRLAPEEERLLAAHSGQPLATRDRRLVAHGLALSDQDDPVPGAAESGFDAALERSLLLEEGEEALRSSWDPSIHVEEAVRAIADLDRAMNLVGERLESWAARDAVRSPGAPSPGGLAAALATGAPTEGSPLPGGDPALLEGRRALAGLWLAAREARGALEAAVVRALPQRAPNLSSLLGPELAARIISQAGGLDRLARLPASTVQVLGAERAFFEHLRGHAPPPRHGLLFLHPTIQSAPRAERGRLARALAGKAAIASRMDLVGSPVDPGLRAAYERRLSAVLAARRAGPGRRGRPSRTPLDGAAEDR